MHFNHVLLKCITFSALLHTEIVSMQDVLVIFWITDNKDVPHRWFAFSHPP